MTKPSTRKELKNFPRRQRKNSAQKQAIAPVQPSDSKEGIAPLAEHRDALAVSNALVTMPETASEPALELALDDPTQLNPEPLTEGAIAEKISAPSSVSRSEWHSAASFTVTVQHRLIEGQRAYQTVVQHLDSGETETWSELKTSQLQNWIETRLTPLDADSTPPSTPPAPEWLFETQTLRVKVNQLQITQPSQTASVMVIDQTHQAFLNSIQSGHPFALGVAFEIVGLESVHPTTPFTYVAQVYARHRHTGLTLPLSSVEVTELAGQGPYYQASFPQVMFEEPGLYRLQILVSLRQVKAPSGFFEIPLLQVI
ncbi:MAG: hypothetical protein SFY66_25525 [Oculatellaceae cyanobacterium bins.114]|nr:hypothetical protein [Oculatellaceae cyanobacterium bins.114]